MRVMTEEEIRVATKEAQTRLLAIKEEDDDDKPIKVSREEEKDGINQCCEARGGESRVGGRRRKTQ